MEIYFDNAATTRPIVEIAFAAHMENGWYNPSAAYAPAADVFLGIKKTRQVIAEIVGMEGECFFTSGGTEANNTAIMSCRKHNAHYITSAIEHPSVYETFRHLETLGARVDYVKPRQHCIQAEDVAALVRKDTALVSIMHVNNETGALNDIAQICSAVKAKNPAAAFHSDGVQALFKTEINLANVGADYYTVSAHKIHALKGTGALLARRGRAIRQMHFGGEQELSLRPGTENTLGIQAFREALERGRGGYLAAAKKVRTLSERLVHGLTEMEGVSLNLPARKVPHIVSASFEGVRAEVLVRLMGEKGIYLGTGAACSRGKISRILLENGTDRALAQGAVRFSLDALNTEDEIMICLEEIQSALKTLRRFRRK